ncbi:hybrid sensor histidine kinase/response regulator [Dissulfurimicrobium hydrothermale]|uniref:hybrid sensor histidine kinase/response regulator n=1 Tax=Dissulfurimicrobium hydrothermale TaxID=1750598 RepID=UPI001EDB5514|nr:PAS domain-containing sensor histidine kinase [Dissulfurimicrobium hydrothermale]UKL13467.1 PAS domain S-box protein [Dissulfurimicrobium hydrothermale]
MDAGYLEGFRILDLVAYPAAFLGLDYKVIWVNRALLEAANIIPEHVLGRPCFEICGKGKPDGGCPHRKFILGGRAVAVAKSDRCLSRKANVIISSLHNGDGLPQGGLHIYFDCYRGCFDDSKTDGRDLREIMLENAAVGIVLVKDRKVVSANRYFGDLFGYNLSEISGRETEIFFPSSDDFRRFGEAVYPRVRQEGHVSIEQFMRHKSGRLFWCRLAGQSVGPDEIVWALEDISVQKEIETELARSEEKFRAISCMASDAIVLMDMDGKVAYWNSTAQKVFGYSSAEAVGRDLHTMLLPDEQIPAYIQAHKRFKETGISKFENKLVEFAAKKKDGERIFVEVSFSSVKIGGKPFFLGIIRDITVKKKEEERRKRLDVKLRQAQKIESLGILAGGVAHDFNNLLMGVLGYAEIALLKLTKESPARPAIQNIIEAAQKAAELSSQMLSYAGRGVFQLETVNLAKLIEETAHLLQSMVSRKVVLKLDLNYDILPVNVDPTQVRQVLMNLLINASEAIGERGGLISVSTGVMHADRAYLSETYLDDDLKEGYYTYIEVSDTGCGMDSETVKKIFDPFFTTKFQGRGLGLAASLGIIRAHRGAIKVYSELGKGSTFKALFPCAQGAFYDKREIKPADSLEAVGNNIIVMVADDEESVRTIARMVLEEFGFKVITAKDGMDAVEKFKKYHDRIDVVILDLIMPHLSGDEVYREMRRISPDVKVVLSSGYSERDVISRFAGKKVMGFLQKPFKSSELLSKIKEALNTK